MINQPSAQTIDQIWPAIRNEAQQASKKQPLMASFFHANILTHHNFAAAISFYLSNYLASDDVPAMIMRDLFLQAMARDSSIEYAMLQDLSGHCIRDPVCDQYITPLLYLKGYHAIQSYRIAHYLWLQGRSVIASYMQSRIAALFDVDIHPAARIGSGIMVDHATGIVIGETSIIEDNVSMLQAVTLGGSGSQSGKRHPTIRQGVLLSAGATVLGNIEIGEGTKIGAGSVVLNSMPAHVTVAGVPAKVVGKCDDVPALMMDHHIEDD